MRDPAILTLEAPGRSFCWEGARPAAQGAPAAADPPARLREVDRNILLAAREADTVLKGTALAEHTGYPSNPRFRLRCHACAA